MADNKSNQTQILQDVLDIPSQALSVIDVSGSGNPSYDYIDFQYPSATQDVVVFKTGGSGGTTVKTVTINYTDATKANIDDVIFS